MLRRTGTGPGRALTALAVLVVLAPLLAGCGGDRSPRLPTLMVTPTPADRYPRPELLADTAWLAERTADPDVRLVDLSPLVDYERGHIPGAVHVWWQDLVEVYNGTYGMLVAPAGRKAVLGRAGITPEMTVVAYDNQGGRYAARFLWVLAYTGYGKGRLLNGGIGVWRAEGRPTTRERPRIARTALEDRPTDESVLYNGEDLLARLGDRSLGIVDARTFAEGGETWNGRLREGRIPGARGVPWVRNLGQLGTAIVRDPEELPKVYETQELRKDQEIIVYGLTGADAAHTFWIMRVLGYERVRLYDGSWAEWGAARAGTPFPIEPLAVGAAPADPGPAAARR
jgi:thiosulfate/3-mercaptopyruvate sulfurtransferase